MKLSATYLTCLTLLALTWGAASAARAEEPAAGKQVAQETDVKVGDETVKLRYWLYLPEGYDGDESMPLMLFLHGAGERGDELAKVKKWGPPKLAESRDDFPFVLISPQCDEGKRWDADALAQLVDHIAGEFAIDKQRMYITGLSMGGYGTWALLAKHPNLFAAALPVCGGGDPASAKSFKHVPIWVFHGDADESVPVERSREMVEALKKLEADVKYTEYPGVGHNSWSQTYGNPQIYKWLLSHTRKQP